MTDNERKETICEVRQNDIEEAIFYIKELQKTYASMDKKVAKAIDMAITVLAVYPQYKWERDVAIEQLDEYGIPFGAKKDDDVVKVVRCKDCKHRGEICSMRYIEMVGEDEVIHDYSTDNGYCSWGERKEDGEA